jgi:MFS family permease
VWVLGLAALLNDASSEMITPLLPVFLSLSLGAGPAIIGLIEGLAEATSSFFKVLSGRWVDRGASAGSLVIAGYTISVTARPWMGLAGSLLGWPVVMFLRFLDRVGKGLRTSPRDSLIADMVEPGARGRAFGLHRALDHTGAVIGPLLAAALLAAGWPLRSVFLFAAVPGLLVLVNLLVGLSPRFNGGREVSQSVPVKPLPVKPLLVKLNSEGLGFRASWRVMPKEIRGLILGGGVLAMVAVPEMLLVLWATSAGVPVVAVPLLWSGLSLAKVVSVYPAGWAVDRYGVRWLLAVGWALRVMLLLVLALVPRTPLSATVLLGLYSMAIALCEPAERAWIGDATKQGLRGRAYGTYYMSVGLAALPGAALLGALWQWLGPSAALAFAALVTAVVAGWLLRRGVQPAAVRSA